MNTRIVEELDLYKCLKLSVDCFYSYELSVDLLDYIDEVLSLQAQGALSYVQTSS